MCRPFVARFPERLAGQPAYRCERTAERARRHKRLVASAQLRRAPGRGQPPLELVAQMIYRDADLLERVAVAQRDRAVLERLVVDGHAPRGADLVLTSVAAADRAALVVLGWHPLAEVLIDLARDLGLAVLRDERQHRYLHRRDLRVEAEQDTLAPLDLLLVVGVDHESEHRAVGAGRRLDH